MPHAFCSSQDKDLKAASGDLQKEKIEADFRRQLRPNWGGFGSSKVRKKKSEAQSNLLNKGLWMGSPSSTESKKMRRMKL